MLLGVSRPAATCVWARQEVPGAKGIAAWFAQQPATQAGAAAGGSHAAPSPAPGPQPSPKPRPAHRGPCEGAAARLPQQLRKHRQVADGRVDATPRLPAGRRRRKGELAAGLGGLARKGEGQRVGGVGNGAAVDALRRAGRGGKGGGGVMARGWSDVRAPCGGRVRGMG